MALDRDWTLRSQVRVERVEPLPESNSCVPSVFGVPLDATNIIHGAIRAMLEAQTDTIDEQISRLPLEVHLEEAWRALYQSFSVGDELWLSLAPRAIHHGRLGRARSEGHLLRTHIGLTAAPSLTLGLRPEVNSAPLPPPQRFDRPADPFEDNTEVLLVEGRAEYGALAERTQAALRSQNFTVLGQPLRIDTVALAGLPTGRVEAHIQVGGLVDGELILTGTPLFDPVQGQMTMPDLEFDFHTHNLLAQAAAWVLRSGFRAQVRRRMQWTMGEVLPWGSGTVHQSLDLMPLGTVQLEGTWGPTRLVHVEATERAVRVWMQTQATLRVESQSGEERSQ